MLRLPRYHRFIEYKYVVYDSGKDKVIWEDGENRYLEFRQIKSTKEEVFMSIVLVKIIKSLFR
jgi:Starch binding domain.